MLILLLLALFQSAYFAQDATLKTIARDARKCKCIDTNLRFVSASQTLKGLYRYFVSTLKKCLFCSCTCTYVHHVHHKVFKLCIAPLLALWKSAYFALALARTCITCITNLKRFVSLLCTFGASKTMALALALCTYVHRYKSSICKCIDTNLLTNLTKQSFVQDLYL